MRYHCVVRRLSIVAFILMLITIFAPAVASASPGQCAQSLLGVVCLSINGHNATVTGPGIHLTVPVSPTVIARTSTVTMVGPTITVPGKTVTVTGPPETRVVTATLTGSPATLTGSPATLTGSSDAVVEHTHTFTVTATPSNDDNGILPDTPAGGFAEGTILGVILGILVALGSLLVVYRKGHKDGEKASLRRFLGEVRGIRKQMKNGDK